MEGAGGESPSLVRVDVVWGRDQNTVSAGVRSLRSDNEALQCQTRRTIVVLRRASSNLGTCYCVRSVPNLRSVTETFPGMGVSPFENMQHAAAWHCQRRGALPTASVGGGVLRETLI